MKRRAPHSEDEFVVLRQAKAMLESELAQAKNLLLNAQKSVTMGLLLGSIAHEINNPLEAMTNLLFLAEQSLSNPEYANTCVIRAEEELQRVGAITKQILSFHRDSREIQNVPVAAVFESVLALHAVRLSQHGIEVVRQYRCEGCLIAYPGEVRQALANLVSNAIDAMQTGGRLIVRVQERHGRESRLCITVADTGSGMSREQSRRVGELFFTTKGESGTGLGMWVTRQLIANYGASFHVYSSTRPGRSGTVCHLCFSKPHARLGEAVRSNKPAIHPRSQTRSDIEHEPSKAQDVAETA